MSGIVTYPIFFLVIFSLQIGLLLILEATFSLNKDSFVSCIALCFQFIKLNWIYGMAAFILFYLRLILSETSFFREIQLVWLLKIRSWSLGYKAWNNKLTYVMVRFNHSKSTDFSHCTCLSLTSVTYILIIFDISCITYILRNFAGFCISRSRIIYLQRSYWKLFSTFDAFLNVIL